LQEVSGKVTYVLDEKSAGYLSRKGIAAVDKIHDMAQKARELFAENGFTLNMDDDAQKAFYRNIANDYLDAAVDENELRVVLNKIKQKTVPDENGFYAISDSRGFYKALQNAIVDYYVDPEYLLSLISRGPALGADDPKYEADIRKIMRQSIRVFSFSQTRDRVNEREYILKNTILINIRPPAGRTGSKEKSDIACDLMLNDVLLNKDHGISEFAIATIVDLCAKEGREGPYILSTLLPMLIESEKVPRIAIGLIYVLIAATDGKPHALPIKTGDERYTANFADTAATIILDLVKADLTKKKSPHTFPLHLLEYADEYGARHKIHDRVKDLVGQVKEECVAYKKEYGVDLLSLAHRSNSSALAPVLDERPTVTLKESEAIPLDLGSEKNLESLNTIVDTQDESKALKAEEERNLAENPVVDGYTIQEFIARGSFGAIYKAVNDTTGQIVAIKVANPIDKKKIALAREHLEIERDFLLKTDRKDFPKIIERVITKTTNGTPCIVMEYINNGRSLS